jgi:hypothetical protein
MIFQDLFKDWQSESFQRSTDERKIQFFLTYNDIYYSIFYRDWNLGKPPSNHGHLTLDL